MPCLNGRLPVAMEVHSIGNNTECRVVRLPMLPCSIRPFMIGIRPASTRRLMVFQSAASQPINRTFGFISVPIELVGKKIFSRIILGQAHVNLPQCGCSTHCWHCRKEIMPMNSIPAQDRPHHFYSKSPQELDRINRITQDLQDKTNLLIREHTVNPVVL